MSNLNPLNLVKYFKAFLFPSLEAFDTSVSESDEADSRSADLDTRSRDSSLPHNPPPLHALIIAIDNYLDTATNKLLGAINDAKAVEDYLKRVLTVPSSQITTLFDDQATRANILQALYGLADDDRINNGDPILIYYAGHGATEPTPNWLHAESSVIQMIIPQNYGKDVYGIRDRTIARLIDRIAEKKGDNITVIFDCCFSGSATRNSTNDPTHLVRGFCLEEPHPGNLDDEFLKDCPDTTGRAAGPAEGFAHTGANSHILLAACGTAERAQEKGRRGAFTKALLDTLNRLDPEKTTYTDLISRIPQLSGQNPQCVGHNRDRTLFNSKAPAQARRYYSVRKEGTHYIIDIGAANGVTVGAQFSLYRDKDSFSSKALASLKVVETNAFNAKLEAISEVPPDSIGPSTVVLQTHAGPEECLRLHIAEEENLERVREVVLKQMDGIGPIQKEILLVDKDKAELDIAYEDGQIIFNILDKRVVDHGLTRIPFCIDPVGNPDMDQKNIDDIPAIIHGAAHYHWQLRRTAAKEGKRGQLQSRVNIEFTKMVQHPEIEYDDHLHRIFQPIGENLNHEGVIDLVADEDDRYGFKITNEFEVPLYVSAFYFDNSDFSIEPLYECPISEPNSKVDPSLQPKGSLPLGYGSSGAPPLKFTLREGQDVDVGFIKLFVSTEQMDLSSVNCKSPFEQGRPLVKNTEDAKPPSLWDTILLTVILRKHGP